MCGEAALPGLSVEVVDRMARSWGDGGLWNDIVWLAERFHSSEPAEQAIAWHHFVMAVGNFKRQPGRRLRPAALTTGPVPLSERPSRVLVPGLEGSLDMRDLGSWRCLQHSLPGAGVATTTTLLSALWPDEHIVFDWRVHVAANALRIHAGLEPTPSVTARRSAGVTETFDDYALVRAWAVSQAARLGARPSAVERTLYRLSQRVKHQPGRTWAQYAAALVRQLDVDPGRSPEP